MSVFLYEYRKFTSSSLHDCTLDTNDVTKVSCLEQIVDFITDNSLVDNNLNSAGTVKQVDKTKLTHSALCHDSSGNGYFMCFTFQFFQCLFTIGCTDISSMILLIKCLSEWINTHFT